MEKIETNEITNTYTAFLESKIFAKGSLKDLVLKIKKHLGKNENNSILIFSDSTGNTLDFNFKGSETEILKRLEMFVSQKPDEYSGPGRPKLGVISREVSLLPRHWEWLAAQSGGASVTIRRLIDESRKKSSTGESVKQVQEKTYKFLSVVAGDFEGYEEALRALYKRDREKFLKQMEKWPKDIQGYAMRLSETVF